KPSDGKPVTMPTQDMVIGLYYLTSLKEGAKGEGRAFSSPGEAIMAYDLGELDLQARIKLRVEGDTVPPEDWEAPEGYQPGQPYVLETTLGRYLFNETTPEDYPLVNQQMGKKQLSALVAELAERDPKIQVAPTRDALKDAGYHWATRSGLTISISDVVPPPNKHKILDAYEKEAEKIQRQYERGLISDEERRQDLTDIWTKATNEVARDMEENSPADNTVWMMVNSGARGNPMQVRQIAGIRGLVSNTKGETITRTIKSYYREGLSVLEYVISTHGKRKGLADTALRTAASGYLTRRLVDVAQDVIGRGVDCGPARSLWQDIGERGTDGT